MRKRATSIRPAALRPLLVIGISFLAVRCQASPSAPAALGEDFKYQGEFLGTAGTGSQALGAQVIADGGGRFTAAFLPGGLPGAGWDTASRTEQNGTVSADGVHFPAASPGLGYAATIAADGSTLSGTTPKGEAFTLQKTLRKSPTLNAPPPANALVLFDGKDLSAFVPGSAVLDSGLLLPQGSASSGAVTVAAFGSFTLHLEFLEPFMPDNVGQARGNSGVYLQGRYELQILDSFGLNLYRGRPGEETQECGAFYQLVAPRLNMSFPPLSWQTYDVEFTQARFDAAGKTQLEPAIVTVRLNGVLIHDHQPLTANTLLGDPVTAAAGPIRFQAHGDPVKYRNIWIVAGAGSAIRSGRTGKNAARAAIPSGWAAAGPSFTVKGGRSAALPGSGWYVLASPGGARAILLAR